MPITILHRAKEGTFKAVRHLRHVCEGLNPLPVAHHLTDFIPPTGRYTQLFEKAPCFVPRDAPLAAQRDQGAKHNEIHYISGKQILMCETRHDFTGGHPSFWSATVRGDRGVRSFTAERDVRGVLSVRLWQDGRIIFDQASLSQMAVADLVEGSAPLQGFLGRVDDIRSTAHEGPISHFRRSYGRILGCVHVRRQLGKQAARHILSAPYFL